MIIWLQGQMVTTLQRSGAAGALRPRAGGPHPGIGEKRQREAIPPFYAALCRFATEFFWRKCATRQPGRLRYVPGDIPLVTAYFRLFPLILGGGLVPLRVRIFLERQSRGLAECKTDRGCSPGPQTTIGSEKTCKFYRLLSPSVAWGGVPSIFKFSVRSRRQASASPCGKTP